MFHAGVIGMFLQPQALAQDFLHCAAHRVLLVAGNRLDFLPRGAQPGFQGIGGIQQFTDRTLAAAGGREQAPEQEQGAHGKCGQD